MIDSFPGLLHSLLLHVVSAALLVILCGCEGPPGAAGGAAVDGPEGGAAPAEYDRGVATPLSHMITRLLESPEDERQLDAFHREFRRAIVGVRVEDEARRAPAGTPFDAGGMRMPLYQLPNGITALRACADPDVFVKRYDPSVNGRMGGDAVLEMVLKMDPSVAGVLVASAASEHSILIPRGAIPAILAGEHAEPTLTTKPWWKFW